MIEAFSSAVIRYIFLAGFTATIAGLGTAGTATTADARSHLNVSSVKAAISIENLNQPFIELAQLKLFKKKRRKKKSRILLNRKPKLLNRKSRSGVSSGKAASLGIIIRRVRRRIPGQLLDARLVKGRGGSLTYRLKILSPKGVMRNVIADAHTGAILGVR